MREPDLTLKPKGPIVYAWLDEADTVIYVGMSAQGVGRPTHKLHPAYNRGLILRVWYCASVGQARLLEKQLILTLQPELNIQLKGSLSESQTKWLLKKSEIQTSELVSWRTNEHPRLGSALRWAAEAAGRLDENNGTG